jgi:phospholipid/cholesterol/gamma-HCH transport system substrate-binding protein
MSQSNATPPGARTEPSDADIRAAVPRTSGAKELRIGIFVLVGIISFLASLYILTDPSTFRGRYIVHTLVADAGGLRKGDPVRMKGVNVGRVHEFSLVSQGVTIALEIEGQWTIPSDSRSRLAASGLMGGRTIEIIPGQSTEPVLSGGSIPGGISGGIIDMADELGTQAGTVFERLALLLSDPTITGVQAGVQEMRTLLADLSSIARSQGAELERLTGTLNRAAEGIEEASQSAPDFASAVARADSALQRVNATSQTLDRAIISLEGLLARIERGEGTLGQLVANDSLYQNLNLAAESVHLLATDVRENPKKYLTVEIF